MFAAQAGAAIYAVIYLQAVAVCFTYAAGGVLYFARASAGFPGDGQKNARLFLESG
jgi:hypothetical protein